MADSKIDDIHVEKPDEKHVDDMGHDKVPDVFIDEALAGTELEHQLRTGEALKAYWKGVILVTLVSMTIVMRGFDASVGAAFFGLPAFQKRFGEPVDGHGYQIRPAWQSAIGVSTTVGQVIGSIISAYPMERYGRKPTLAVCLICTSVIIPMEAFAPSIQVLVAGEYLAGFVLGFYQVLIPTYSSELLPNALRPYLAAYINACYNIGGLIIAGVTAGFATWDSEWAYKIPFCLQWVWPIVLLPVVYLTPESPWWLIRKGKIEQARKALYRLGNKNHPRVDFEITIAMMQKTTLYEQQVESGTTIWDCFRGTSRYRTEVVIMIFFCQDFSLSPISAAYFFEQLGFTTQKAFDLNIGGSAIALGCSLLSGFFLNKFGRRSTFTIGIGILAILQLCVGFLQLPSNYDQNPGFGYGQVSLLFFAGAVYNLTIGPFCYAILSEVPSISLRSKAIAVSISFDAMYGIITNFITPYLVNPGVANARGRVDFMYGGGYNLGALLTVGISVFSFIWCYYRLPETKHRTVEELDYLFDHRVNARKFKGYVITADDLRHNLDQAPEHRV